MSSFSSFPLLASPVEHGHEATWGGRYRDHERGAPAGPRECEWVEHEPMGRLLFFSSRPTSFSLFIYFEHSSTNSVSQSQVIVLFLHRLISFFLFLPISFFPYEVIALVLRSESLVVKLRKIGIVCAGRKALMVTERFG